jgi:hypothetical protein
LSSAQARFRQPHKAGLVLVVLLVAAGLMPWRLAPRANGSAFIPKSAVTGDPNDGLPNDTIQIINRFDERGFIGQEKVRVIRRGDSVQYVPVPDSE